MLYICDFLCEERFVQESLFQTVQKLQSEKKINVEELETLLNSDIEEVVTLCKKACLKPKTDSMGNAYFTKTDVDTLKKIKELYSQSQQIRQSHQQEENSQKIQKQQEPEQNEDLSDTAKKINFLTKAKNRMKPETLYPSYNPHPTLALQSKIDALENNLIKKMSEILSEKMDGFDEIIVELIRSKTENENLRQQVNSLNKQVFILKNELATYTPLPLGLYIKKDNNDM